MEAPSYGKTTKPRFTANCTQCGIAFKAHHPNQILCSDECRNKRYQTLYKRVGAYPNLPTGTVGAITEVEVVSDLMKKGYAVFRAISPACFCDIIAIHPTTGESLKIEARTGYRNQKSGVVHFPTAKHGDINCFAVYTPLEDKIYYFQEDTKTPKLIAQVVPLDELRAH